MKVSIRDPDALRAVSPAALAAYARSAGWRRGECYRTNSNIYTDDVLPEIVIPRTANLGDYASVVRGLIETFAEVTEQDELAVYRSVVTADKDVVRIRAAESDDGSLAVDDGVDLIAGARDLLLATACSLRAPKAVYRAGANRDASDLVRQMRLGQTDHGSFVVTLLTPVIPSAAPALFPDPDDAQAPIERRMTKRLVEALAAARQATEWIAAGEEQAFAETVANGVSANLCEAMAQIVKPFSSLEVSVSWALTRPMTVVRTTFRFGRRDAPMLREAARLFREQAPLPDQRLYGFVRLLKREAGDVDGTISLTTDIDGRRQSVAAVLEQRDYERAVQAHSDKALVVLMGDLERYGQRWRLLNPHLERVLRDNEQEPEDD